MSNKKINRNPVGSYVIRGQSVVCEKITRGKTARRDGKIKLKPIDEPHVTYIMSRDRIENQNVHARHRSEDVDPTGSKRTRPLPTNVTEKRKGMPLKKFFSLLFNI